MTDYTLELSFSAQQVTQALSYRIYDSKRQRYGRLKNGPLAGTYNFQKGDTLLVQVIGSAERRPGTSSTPKLSYEIINFTQVSIKPPTDQDLSLFDPDNACTVSSDWNSAELLMDEAGKEVTVTTTAKNPLTVTAEEGTWKISGYLSVQVTLDGKTSNKLYFFDPEGSAGTGGWG